MLSPTKKENLLADLKLYRKKYLDANLTELDESGTRLMINSFLSDVLRYKPIEEIKTEYMIKGTYADYIIQIDNVRHLLVEVKALSFQLTQKHLRQAINYGANEGIEWALLTNGRVFELYKILFEKPIQSRKIFSVDLSAPSNLKKEAGIIQCLHRDAILKESLLDVWSKCEALDPLNIAGILYSSEGLEFIRKCIRRLSTERCEDDDIVSSLNVLLTEKIDPQTVKPLRSLRQNKKKSDTGEKVLPPPAEIKQPDHLGNK